MSRASSRHGILVIDKPEGMSSFAVVREVRRVLRARKAGHTGTLDPLASGVLPVCIEEATKIAGLLLAEDKEYTARARLGVQTDTLDCEGRVLEERDFGAVSRGQVEATLAGLLGTQMQVPPAYSAVRAGGERAYQRARRGEEVVLPPRQVTIHRLRLTGWSPPDVELELACTKGTFVRSVVAELGQRLGCGAVLTGLRRLRSGGFDLSRAVSLERLAERRRSGDLPWISIDEALAHLPAVEISTADLPRLRQGQPVGGRPDAAATAGLLRLRSGGALVALGEEREGRFWPRRVFHLG